MSYIYIYEYQSFGSIVVIVIPSQPQKRKLGQFLNTTSDKEDK